MASFSLSLISLHFFKKIIVKGFSTMMENKKKIRIFLQIKQVKNVKKTHFLHFNSLSCNLSRPLNVFSFEGKSVSMTWLNHLQNNTANSTQES